MVGAGRFAPSPSGDLHLGNLRTALLAWLFARTTGREFLIRVEDLDRVRPGAMDRQLDDLRALGLGWDGEVVKQSDRLPLYAEAIETLNGRGLTYPCFCTRKEILQAPSAPHSPDGAYPGTCRNLSASEQAEKLATGRNPALRLRSDTDSFTVTDTLRGNVTGAVDDVVLLRGDGVPAYNLAVVVDDGAQNIDQVVRGDDLLSSAPRQAHLATLLGITPPVYAHVPLALNTAGKRLAKRDGAVTLSDQRALGRSSDEVLTMIASSVGLAEPGELITPMQLAERFDAQKIPHEPWIVTVDDSAGPPELR
ncbi:tRNA glutamyl-Q(34) synthetase GluQRS [Rhodococcus sp. SRB_17]|uniref:tRNA glutamyl-Q(34) synthetase GluQRS n=1 Tax=Rhodococcus sp. OK302 TaxID=1882769 RepID=UPI000B945BF3|nr:tRNA glutamyl-Q(34) synthetase GluQRS [Rhodococcus sp. OK302]NMM83741.1 tRNA glutamyl-Q(34) synthetase GluQRS [Rhodococcus sp. SRB_17]OYD67660.1 glutamyl-tRNA synthetase [Rhodococcus sp. OK302]